MNRFDMQEVAREVSRLTLEFARPISIRTDYGEFVVSDDEVEGRGYTLEFAVEQYREAHKAMTP